MSEVYNPTHKDILRHYPADPAPWALGDELTFADITEFVQFEDTLPRYIDQTATEHWAARPNIRDQLRPAKFNGRLVGITLVSVARDCHDDKPWLSIEGKRGGVRPTGQSIPEREFAFDFFARAVSSGRGQIGTISSALLYRPGCLNQYDVGQYHKSSHYPYGIRRQIQKPVIDTETAFEELVETSRANARRLERAAIKSAITTPMGT